MCRHIYHHYQGCGHISNYTMESCCAFTNQLRMFATIGDLPTQQSYSACDDIETFHDILPADYPDFCLKCAYDWSDCQMGVGSKPSPPPSTVIPIEDTEMRHTQGSGRDLESENSLSTDCSLHLEPLVECDALETQVHELSEKGDESDAVLTNLEWDWLRNPMGHPVQPPSPPCPDVSEETESTERSLLSRSSGFACISHAPSQEGDEEIPFSVTNSLAQLDLDCTEDSFSSRPSSSSTNKIDLLSALPSREEILAELVQVFKQQASSPNFSEATFDTCQDSPKTRPLLLKGFRCSESRSSLWRADMSSASSPNFSRMRPALNADDWLSELDDFTLLWTYRRSYVKEKEEREGEEEDAGSSMESFYTADEKDEEDQEDEEEGGCSLL